MSPLAVLIKKEFRQILRNRFLPKLIIVFPIVVMMVIPWITTMDVHHVNVAFLDDDRSQISGRIFAALDASDYFSLVQIGGNYEQALSSLEHLDIDVILQIPAGFEESVLVENPKKISIAANAVNSIKGVIGMQYVLQCVGHTFSFWRAEQGLPVWNDDIVVQNRYNPTLNYRFYMIPAIMIMLLIILCGFLPALSLVGEKERGTMEQINVTPVSRFTFAMSKLIPYWLIGLFILSAAMLIAKLVYGLAPQGSLLTIYAAALLFVLSISGFGVTIANCSDNMQQTMFVMFFFMIIFILMSGLLTPVQSMPSWAQRLTLVFPPRYFVQIMRSVYLKGSHFIELWPYISALGGFAFFLNVLAALTYRKRN